MTEKRTKDYGYCSVCGREHSSLQHKFKFNGVCYLCMRRVNKGNKNAK